MADKDEKTEQPTSRRRSQARKEGQVAKSIELNSSVLLIMSFLYFLVAGPKVVGTIKEFAAYILRNTASFELKPETLPDIYMLILKNAGRVILPFLIYIFVVGVIVNIAQVGWFWTWKPMKPKMLKLNIFKGFKKIFGSKDAAVKLIKSILKMSIIFWVLYVTIKPYVPEFVKLSDNSSLTNALMFAIGVMTKAIYRTCLMLLVIAVIDFFYQRHKHEKDLKMTKQEVKDERKNMDIDPKIKAKIRQMQMQMARKRMMGAVPEADVVVTNPTTFAVAIKYDPETMDAPIVVAKGARLIAQKIKQIAIDNNVPIVEDKPLARDLYKNVEINQPVPLRLYKAVAKVMAYVYNLRKAA